MISASKASAPPTLAIRESKLGAILRPAVVAVTMLLVVGACRPAIHGDDPIRADVEAEIEAHAQFIPVVATLRREETLRECRVTHWATLHPDDGDRIWGPLQRFEVDEISQSAPELGDARPSFIFGTATFGGPNTQVLWVAPWAGDAEIFCGGEPVAPGASMVFTGALFALDAELGGITGAEAFERASVNVSERGVRSIVDRDLTVLGGCGVEPNCNDNEPPEPDDPPTVP